MFNSVTNPVNAEPSPSKDPLNEPESIDPSTVEVIAFAPIAKIPPVNVIPLFSIRPPLPAIRMLLSVSVEDVIAAKWADDPLTIIFFQFAMSLLCFYIL